MANADARQFKALIEPHLDALFRAAHRLTRNRADAEDLVQEACVRAYVRLAELRETERAKAWALSVLHNVFVDDKRRARRSAVVADGADVGAAAPSLDPSPEESAYAAQREERLHRAWLELDRGHRALLALRAEGYTHDEIAEITGIAKDALNARLYRARQSLAHCLLGLETQTRMEIAK
jgi:RNA polymerase sigma-70 factor (ECF subfamily)